MSGEYIGGKNPSETAVAVSRRKKGHILMEKTQHLTDCSGSNVTFWAQPGSLLLKAEFFEPLPRVFCQAPAVKDQNK